LVEVDTSMNVGLIIVEKKRLKRALLCLLLCSLFAPCRTSFGQWTRIPHNRRTPRIFTSQNGALAHKDGVVWAGDSILSVSYDFGQSWRATAYPSLYSPNYAPPIQQIAFFDAFNGVVLTQGGTLIYKTNDGGLTWHVIFDETSSSFYPLSICYPAPNTIIMNEWGGAGLITRDDGLSWTNLSLNYPATLSGKPGLIASLSWVVPSSSKLLLLCSSTDIGNSWQSYPCPINADTWSLALDSCNSDRIVLANENRVKVEGVDHSFVIMTEDRGKSWDTIFVGDHAAYVSGSIERGRRGIYFGTTRDGVMRSLDYGATWKSIGGPNGYTDQFNLCVINDNLILAIDTEGDIWRTTNSGGSWVTASEVPTAYAFEPARLFDSDSVLVCDSATSRAAYFTTAACDNLTMLAQTISGADKNYFSIVSPLPSRATGLDSVVVAFHPDAARDYSAVYSATIGGRIVSLPLSGHCVKGKFLSKSDSVVQFDTMSTCGTAQSAVAKLVTSTCGPWSIKSLHIAGIDSAQFLIDGVPPASLSGLDSLHLMFFGDSNRAYHAKLVIELDGGLARTIDLGGYATGTSLPIVTLGAELGPIVNVTAGGVTQVPINLTGNLSQSTSDILGLRSISISMQWNTDLLSPTGVTLLVPGAQLKTFTPTKGKIFAEISLPSGFTFNGPTLIGYVNCYAFVSDTTRTSASIESLGLQSDRPCIATAAVVGWVDFKLIPACGNPTLTSYLSHGIPFTINSIIPNPSKGEFHVSVTGHLPLRFEVFDLLGTNLKSGEFTSGDINLHSLAQGTYYLRLSAEGYTITRRLVKQ
jgi:photosystem II stability/assembly factor-like uncharacterized protein